MKNSELVKWTLTTILVIIGVFILIRLGFWQLDRLEWRRAFNQHYITQISAKSINLNDYKDFKEIAGMEYREISVSGFYDFEHEIYLQNQAYQNVPGYRIVTPLLIDNKDIAVYIDRGWISFEDLNNIDHINNNYTERQKVTGIVRISQPDFNLFNKPVTQKKNNTFFLFVDLEDLQARTEYEITPFYIQVESRSDSEKPYSQLSEYEITEGPHFGYAMQWFFFACLLGIGYPFFVSKQLREKKMEIGIDEK